MQDDERDDSGPGIENFRVGEERLIDPDTIGRSDTRSGGGEGNGDGGDSGSGGSYSDGYGAAGKYGNGRFPDGRSRKRKARGSGGTNQSTGAGTAEKPRKANKNTIDPSGIEFMLMAIHLGISQIAEKEIPDDEKVIPLQDEQAKQLSVAIAKVARHYEFLAMTPKAADHLQLLTVAGSVYGPMAMVLLLRYRERREAEQRTSPDFARHR